MKIKINFNGTVFPIHCGREYENLSVNAGKKWAKKEMKGRIY